VTIKPFAGPLLPRRIFYKHLVRSAIVFVVVLTGSLAIGIVGYHVFAKLNWLDALLNASMILTGMGPVDRLESTGAKWFASLYAIFSGVAFLSSVGVLLAPVLHRLIHRFHLEDDDDAEADKDSDRRGKRATKPRRH